MEAESSDKQITIDWVRHAESCANVAQGELASHTMYHPNLTDLGMQQAIVVGNTYIKPNIQNQREPYDFVFASPTFRTITTAMMALRGTKTKIYIAPYISEAQTVWEYGSSVGLAGDVPNRPVDIKILIQVVTFIKDWLEKSWVNYFPDVELISVLDNVQKILIDDAQIRQITSSIIECSNDKCGNIEKIRILIEQLELRLKPAMSYRSSYGNIPLEDQQKQDIRASIEKLKMFLDREFVRCPEVDFSIYKQLIAHHESGAYKSEGIVYDVGPSFDKFYERVLTVLFAQMQRQPNLQNMRILCFSHGSIIKQELSKYTEIAKLKNTQVIRDTIKIAGPNNTHTIEQKYRPQTALLPKTDPDNDGLSKPGEDEQIDKIMKTKQIHDFCTIDGLKGILNYPIWKNDPKYLGKGWLWNAEPAKTHDVAFYYDNPAKYSAEATHGVSSVKGGGMISSPSPSPSPYYAKYIKYKTKYMQLKNIQGL